MYTVYYTEVNLFFWQISCTKDKLKQIESRLTQAIHLYKRRLEWLTTESRRILGVVEERAVSIVLDIKNMSPQQFDQYRAAVERVLREQVSQLAKFNLIRWVQLIITCMQLVSQSTWHSHLKNKYLIWKVFKCKFSSILYKRAACCYW